MRQNNQCPLLIMQLKKTLDVLFFVKNLVLSDKLPYNLAEGLFFINDKMPLQHYATGLITLVRCGQSWLVGLSECHYGDKVC